MGWGNDIAMCPTHVSYDGSEIHSMRSRVMINKIMVLNRAFQLIRSMKSGARNISSVKLNSRQESAKLRRGHLAVHVGISEEDTCRVLVSVFYFNHPLFVELLKEAEEVYGFDHQGAIQIPCWISELKEVQRKIAADCSGGSRRR